MTGDVTSRQIVPKSPACPEGLFLMDGIEGLRSLPKHSVDMLLTDPPYGTTRNFWDVPLPLPELWEAVKWAVKPDGAVLFFAQCPYDKVLGASNLSMLRYEWVWYKSRCTGFLNARRAPLKRTENILVFYQKLPYHKPHFSRRYQAMRIILKLLAAPFVLALTLLVAVLNFAFSFASWVFCALSFLCLIGALFALFTGDRWGIQGLVIAFAVSPFGLPAVAEWLIDKLDSLNYSLKSGNKKTVVSVAGYSCAKTKYSSLTAVLK